jgi:hypothetical protein
MGAGTVPGSFLAGTMMPQKMADYRRAYESSMLASDLANEHQWATNKDYLLNSDLRNTQRKQQIGDLNNQIAMQPGARKLATIQQEGAIERGPTEQKHELQKVLSQMSAEKRQETIGSLTHAATILQGYKDPATGKLRGDPAIIAGELKAKYNVDISPDYIEGLSSILPDLRKAQEDYRREQMKEEAATGRTKITAASNERIAAGHDKAKTSGTAKPTPASLEAKATEIQARMAAGEEVDPVEEAFVASWKENQTLKANIKAQENANAAAAIPAGKVATMTEQNKKKKELELMPEMKGKTMKWNMSTGKYDIYDPKNSKDPNKPIGSY